MAENTAALVGRHKKVAFLGIVETSISDLNGTNIATKYRETSSLYVSELVARQCTDKYFITDTNHLE